MLPALQIRKEPLAIVAPFAPVLHTFLIGWIKAKEWRKCYPAFMAVQSCTVTFTDSNNIRHSVDVTAESLFEAAVLGLKALQSCGWSDGPGPGSHLEITVRAPAVSHSLTVSQISAWLQSAGKSPKEHAHKARLRELLGNVVITART